MKKEPLQQKEQEARRTRRDKGERHLTARDMWVLRWIADQYAVRLDQLRQLLSREPGNRNGCSPGPKGLTDSAVLQVIRRWREVPAWVEYERIYVTQGWVWLTSYGERLLDLPYAKHTLRESRLAHRYYINAVRLDIERRHPEYQWRSERYLLSHLPRRERAMRLPHVPDGELWMSSDCGMAVEVELSPKSDQEVDAILLELGPSISLVEGSRRAK